jgi:hypothetical protein
MNRANAMKQSGKIMPSEMATELLFFLPDGAGVGGKGDGGKGDGGPTVGGFVGTGVGAVHPALHFEAVGYFPFALNFSLQLYVLLGTVNWQSKLVMGTGVGAGVALHHVPISGVQVFSKTQPKHQDRSSSTNTAYLLRPSCILAGLVAVTARTIES